MVVVPVTLIAIVIPMPKKNGAGETSSTQPNQRVAVPINTRGLSEQTAAANAVKQQPITAEEVQQRQEWVEYEVKSGDTLANVFRNNGLSMTELNALAKIEGVDKPLSQIRQGQLVRFKRDDDGKLDILQLENGNDSIMFFRLSDGGFARSK